VDLIGKISGFSSYTMADLFFHIKAARSGNRVLFYDQAGECILIAGRRAVAWPSLSKAVRRVYAPVIRSAAHNSEREDVLLLNPTARALVAMDDRVSYAVHDVFTPWTGPRPDVVKVANLLRRLYFRDEMIETGLRAILDSLDDGGHLLIVDNPRIPGGGTRGGLYRREAGRFVIVAQTDDPPEIVDLIVSVETAGRIASSSPEICS
jgi:hypothetical protein